jgi:LAS superfamily LD-carboxypeptidase LdcB
MDPISMRLQQAAQNTQQQPGPSGLPDVFNPDFEDRINSLMGAVSQDGGQANVFSGPRSTARQEQMYLSALERYGDEKLARKYYAPPGESLHEAIAGQKYGLEPGALAADLSGDLQKIYDLAPKFGLEFANKQQPWHVQYAGLGSIG